MRSAFLAAVVTAASAVLAAAPQAPLHTATFDAAWKIVRDSHFDPDMNGVDWDAVRTELRPRAAAARTPAELRAAIRDMLARLGQSHFALIPASADPRAGASSDQSGEPGFDVRLVDADVLVTRVDTDSGAAIAGVRPGWRLTAIEGTPVADILSVLPEAMPERLRQVEAWRLVEGRIRGPRASAVQVTFADASDRPVALSITRRAAPGQFVTVGNLPSMQVRVDTAVKQTASGARVAVIGFNVWMPAVDPLFQRAIDQHRTADGIVLDLRGNPGGLAAMLMGISGHFLDERKPLGVMKTRETELTFMSNPRRVSGEGKRVEPFSGPLAILVDALTGSASECFAGGLQSLERARIVGQPSMGQALPALFSRLPNGDVLIHAYGDFVTSDGTRLEGRGVVPDDLVPLRREDLLAGRDAPLERALLWIDSARRSPAGGPAPPGGSLAGGGRAPVAPAGGGLLHSTYLRSAIFPANLIGNQSGE